jgi:hypothetical protein
MSSSGLLNQTNQSRAKSGKAALKLNSKLSSAAQSKAKDMSSRNYWSHNTPDGDTPWTFVIAKKYKYQKLGENLAAGFSDEQSTINGWMASAPHRANLLDASYGEVGFGYVNVANYTAAGGGPMTLVVAFYGKPQVLSATTSTSGAGSTSKPSSAAAAKNQTPSVASTKKSASLSASETQELDVSKSSSGLTVPNTESNLSNPQLAGESSFVQMALAQSQLAYIATTIMLVSLFAAIGIWLSRHAWAIRHAVVSGERFAIRHPLMDIGLLIIAALTFLLSQTVGLVQ